MVIDCHTHVGAVGSGSADNVISDENGGKADPQNLQVDYSLRTDVMDDNAIDAAVVMPSFTYDRRHGIESTEKLNDEIERIANEHDRFVCAIGTVEPTHGDLALQELERLADKGFEGICWHHEQQGVGIDSERSVNCIQKTAELGMLPIIHCFSPHWNFEHLDRLERIVDVVEDQPMLVLDTMTIPDNIEKIIEIGKQHDHVYFDTALMFSIGRVVEKVVEGLGADRIVFGSDLYTRPLMYRYSSDLYQIRQADITDRERDLILEENIQRLLNL